MDKTPDVDHLLIEMYHKCTHETSKQRILDKFSSKANSVIRCIVATVALGMGIDIPDVRLLVHIGCPKSIISHWQEAGRCARDGQQGFSMILYDNFTASLKTTDKAMSKMLMINALENKSLMFFPFMAMTIQYKSSHVKVVTLQYVPAPTVVAVLLV